MQTTLDSIAERLVALNNSSPRLPRKDEIVALLASALGEPQAQQQAPHVDGSARFISAGNLSYGGHNLILTGWRLDPTGPGMMTRDRAAIGAVEFVLRQLRQGLLQVAWS